jgi:bacterioferritin
MREINDKRADTFSLDREAIRQRAREHIDDGAVTGGYKGNRKQVIQLLNDSLATELVCVLRYRRHHFMSANLGGIAGFAITGEFLQHSQEEQAHADQIAERIVQLGGEPDFNPEGFTSRSHASYGEGKDLAGMVREDLIAERIAVETYGEIVRYLGDKDPTTRRMLEAILAQEEEHADDMSDFLRRLSV